MNRQALSVIGECVVGAAVSDRQAVAADMVVRGGLLVALAPAVDPVRWVVDWSRVGRLAPGLGEPGRSVALRAVAVARGEVAERVEGGHRSCSTTPRT